MKKFEEAVRIAVNKIRKPTLQWKDANEPVYGSDEAVIAISVEKALREVCRSDGEGLWIFDGRRYARISRNEMRGVVVDVMRKAGFPVIYVVQSGAVVERWCWNRLLYVLGGSEWKEGDRKLLAFTNGILEVETGAFEQFSPESDVTIALPYDYSPRAQCTKWESIWERLLPNPADRQLLQDMIGWNMFTNRDWSWWGLDGKHHGLPKSILEEMYVATGFVPGNSEDGEDIDICFDVATNTGEFNSTWCKEMFREEIQGIFGWCYSGYRNVLARGGRVMPETQETEIVPKVFGDEKEIWTDAPF